MEPLVHNPPHTCRIYAQHCHKAFVLGTSVEHNRCWKFWLSATRATRISGAAFFKHNYIANPAVSPEDRVIAAAGVLSNAHLHASIDIQVLGDLQEVFQ
jgi:hypothetical protein